MKPPVAGIGNALVLGVPVPFIVLVIAAVLVGQPYTNAVEFTGRGSLQVRTSDFGAFCAQIAVLTRENGIALRELLPTDESLESVFGYLIAGSSSSSAQGQGS